MANLSQERRTRMLAFLDKLRVQNQDDVEQVRAINEIERAINEKKYGLVWEEHTERVDEMLEDHIPVLKEVEERKIVANEEEGYNFLIEGDNLHSLKLLEKTHRGKIDVIYIDPPYNTKNKDFVYNDCMIGEDDAYRHSKWLSFMEKRLRVSVNLLSSDGIIFISIDDNEQAQLKLLCDEIFGEANMISILCVELSKTQGMKVKSAQEGRIVKNHEYVYVYCKNIDNAFENRMPLYDKTDIWDNHFNKVIIKEKNEYSIFSISEYIKTNRKDIYTIFEEHGLLEKNKITDTSIRNGILLSERLQNFFYREASELIFQEMACSITIPEIIDKLLDEVEIVEYNKYLLTKTSSGKLRQYRSLVENIKLSDEYVRQFERVTIRGALWKGFYSDMMNVQKEGTIDFKNGKKPIRLIFQLNKWINRKNSIILDFFAGSGTTGHAVAALNKEDGGNRKYILCTNNENNICEEVTYKRLQNIQGELPHNLKYLRTDFVQKFSEDEEEALGNMLVRYIKPLIELEHACDLENSQYRLILDEEEFDEFVAEGNIPEGGKLFIADDIFVSSAQQVALDQKQCELVRIPEYYYREELVEAGEL